MNLKEQIKKMRSFRRIFYNNDPSDLTPLSQEEYKKALVTIGERKAKKALEMAWVIRNFEIEMYWKRANYFWAFIASTFVGYFALISSLNYTKPDKFNHVEVYILVCIGFILSVAWILTNKGSKTWQRNWESHVDLLEDQFTGPLYKIVYPTITYSVSNLNEIVSFAFAIIWLLLGIKYFFDQDLINLSFTNTNWFVVLATLGVIFALSAMILGYGRGRFTERRFKMYRRKITYVE